MARLVRVCRIRSASPLVRYMDEGLLGQMVRVCRMRGVSPGQVYG